MIREQRLSDPEYALFLELSERASNFGFHLVDRRTDTADRFAILQRFTDAAVYETPTLAGLRDWLGGEGSAPG